MASNSVRRRQGYEKIPSGDQPEDQNKGSLASEAEKKPNDSAFRQKIRDEVTSDAWLKLAANVLAAIIMLVGGYALHKLGLL